MTATGGTNATGSWPGGELGEEMSRRKNRAVKGVGEMTPDLVESSRKMSDRPRVGVGVGG